MGETQARNQFDQPIRGVSLWVDAWRRLKKNRMALIGLGVIVVYIVAAALAPVLPILSFKQQVLSHQYLPPSLTRTAGQLLYERQERLLVRSESVASAAGLSEASRQQLAELRERLANQVETYNGVEFKVNDRRYILGTDSLGRDMLARIVYGSQVSIAIGIVGTLTAVLIGVLVGSIAGFVGGTFDSLAMRFVDVLYGLPYMLLVIIFMAVFGRSIINLFVCLALVSWLTTARVVRGQIISLSNAEFVQAARVVGAGTGRIIFRHLLPNTLGVVVVFTTLQIPSFILLESFLSFIGLGVQAPMSSWGSLVRDGTDAMDNYPWMLFFPALTMTIFLFSMNFLGDGLRDALDPQSKNRL